MRQRQYLQLYKAFLAGTEDAELQAFAQRHGLKAQYVRLLIPSSERSTFSSGIARPNQSAEKSKIA